MKLYPLLGDELKAHGGATHRAVLTHEDLTETTANTAQTVALATVENKVAVECVYADLVTPFQDASDAAFNTNTLTVGDGGSAARLLAEPANERERHRGGHEGGYGHVVSIHRRRHRGCGNRIDDGQEPEQHRYRRSPHLPEGDRRGVKPAADS